MARSLAQLPDPAAVLFDLDGTLVDTVQTRIDAWLATLADAGFVTTRERLAPLIGVDGKRLVHEIAALAGRSVGDDRAETIDRECGERYEHLNRSPRPLPGVQPLIEAIEGRGMPWAIATSSRAAQVGASVAALGLAREPRIVDASGVRHAKPEPDLLLLAAKRLGVAPEGCWYVGDSTWDMAAAVAAAMIPVGVTAGSAVSAIALEGAGAATVARTLYEVADRLA